MGFLDILFGNGSSFDMTKDYIGKHGEFDRNDEDRAICEDMFTILPLFKQVPFYS